MCAMSDTDLHAAVIQALGGKAKLAGLLGIDRDVLSKWHVRGIPARYWHRVVELTAQLDPPLIVTAADLDAAKLDTKAEAV